MENTYSGGKLVEDLSVSWRYIGRSGEENSFRICQWAGDVFIASRRSGEHTPVENSSGICRRETIWGDLSDGEHILAENAWRIVLTGLVVGHDFWAMVNVTGLRKS